VYIQCANAKDGRQVQVVICAQQGLWWTSTGKKDEVAGHCWVVLLDKSKPVEK